ncbi:MAG: DEAD/DEAH box helicase family protein, partial [Euryarchaeota archaeon]|nr:DEAD/DEAH box helicase family protein [Euryarchaeota archaeon]
MERNRPQIERAKIARDAEQSPTLEPLSVLACEVPTAGTPPPQYWHAQDLASVLHRDFEALKEQGDFKAMRGRFYVLAYYYARTMGILRQALARGKTPLIDAALHNLVALHQPLHHMHDVAPKNVPFVLTLDTFTRRQLVEDSVMEILLEASEPLALETIVGLVNEFHVMADVKSDIVGKHLDNLIEKGHVQRADDGYVRTKRRYSSMNLDRASLQALLGQSLYREFERSGFHGLSSIADRKEAFREFFERFTGCGTHMADMFIAVASELLGPPSSSPDIAHRRHADLIGSLYPRPYQRDAYTIFRGYGYQGQVIEAPAGSGKTMIGMMCIQDWLRTLSQGESILILVPTINYEQQWIAELCYKHMGLRLSPDELFAGTPATLDSEHERAEFAPTVLVMTYAALAQLGSPAGKGGFDRGSVEKYLQGTNIRYVILDEVHKVVEDLKSVSAGVARLLVEWLRDGSLYGLIGFSGTAAAYRKRFARLGLQLVYTVLPADLIVYGFVAPFTERGVPFSYSDREKRVISLLEKYKALLRDFIELIGSDTLRKWFAEIPLGERITIGRDILGMYRGRTDQREALAKRYRQWENDEQLGLARLPVISIVQIAKRLSDASLIELRLAELPYGEQQQCRERFQQLLLDIEETREELRELVHLPRLAARLSVAHFGYVLDSETLQRLSTQASSRAPPSEQVKDALATSIVGLYFSLRSYYFHVGEGRVDSIKAIINAENSARAVSGVVVFDKGTRIQRSDGVVAPSYVGVAGVFAQMLGDAGVWPMAVLSSEMYLPWSETNTVPSQIAEYIKTEIMSSELGEALFDLLTQGVAIPDHRRDELHDQCRALLADYIQGLSKIGASRPGGFNRKVLRRFRRAVNKAKLGGIGETLKSRLAPNNHHIRKWEATFFDYALIAARFLKARPAELRQASGVHQRFLIVTMPQGERKQLMYDLTSRIVDAPELPINVVIVSSWARTGWNVVRPNLLIDATATRDPTAWQQLRGRAMRASPTWDRDCYELMMRLLSSEISGLTESFTLSPEVVVEESTQTLDVADVLDERAKRLLLEAHEFSQSNKRQDHSRAARDEAILAKVTAGKLSRLSEEEKERLAAELMFARNKVTHIYELIKAYGSSAQIRFDRPSQRWQRAKRIAAKHRREYSVNPITGEYGAGEGHAPLEYVLDPRDNLPSQLQGSLTNELKDADQPVVRWWIASAISEQRDKS